MTIKKNKKTVFLSLSILCLNGLVTPVVYSVEREEQPTSESKQVEETIDGEEESTIDSTHASETKTSEGQSKKEASTSENDTSTSLETPVSSTSSEAESQENSFEEKKNEEKFLTGITYEEQTHTLFIDEGAYTDLGLKIKQYDTAEHVVLRGPVKLLEDSGLSLFSNFVNLKSVNAELFDVSEATSLAFMFNNTASLKELDVSNWATGQVTDMIGLFAGSGIESLDLSQWNTSQVRDMSLMFSENTALSNLDAGQWDTSQVTDMSAMFRGMTNLTTIDVSGWNVGGVTNMSNMFDGTEHLTTLNVSNWDTSQVTDMSHMFSFSGVSQLDVSQWNTSQVKSMAHMFSWASQVTDLNVTNWAVSQVTDMSYMFSEANSLSTLDLSNWTISSLTKTQFMFSLDVSAIDISQWDTKNIHYQPTFDTENLVELTLGEQSLLKDAFVTSGLLGWDIPNDVEGYTNRWIGVNTGKVYGSTLELFETYDGTFPDTYRREKRTGISPTPDPDPTPTKEASIDVSNQTMYVGQVLTEKMMLAWATFHYSGEVIYGFEVVDGPIKIDTLTNTLASPGSYTIRYYINDRTRTSLAEEVITLTVKENPKEEGTPEADDPTDSLSKGPTHLTGTTGNKGNVSKETNNSNGQTQLPLTGEHSDSPAINVLGVGLVLGVMRFMMYRLKKRQ